MPIRSFTCPSCNEQFERIYLTRTAYELTEVEPCPECGTDSPADPVNLVGRRNPAHGLQN